MKSRYFLVYRIEFQFDNVKARSCKVELKKKNLRFFEAHTRLYWKSGVRLKFIFKTLQKKGIAFVKEKWRKTCKWRKLEEKDASPLFVWCIFQILFTII